MRKFLMAGAVCAAFAGSAIADTTVDLPLEGVLPKACDISAFINGPFDAIDMESTANQGAESVSVNCNYGGSASVQFSSANSGEMVSGSNGVPYLFSLSGSPLSGGVALTTPVTWNGFPATTNTNQTRGASITLTTAATVAGTYTDTITATVTPN